MNGSGSMGATVRLSDRRYSALPMQGLDILGLLGLLGPLGPLQQRRQLRIAQWDSGSMLQASGDQWHEDLPSWIDACERAKVDHLTTLERDVSAIRSAVSALSCTSRQGSASHRLQTPEIVASLLRQLCGELMSSVGRRADTAFFQRSVRAGISTSIRLSFLHAQHLP